MSDTEQQGELVELFGGPMDGESWWFMAGSLSLVMPQGRYVLRRSDAGTPAAHWETL